MAKYRVKVIGHLCKNNHVAKCNEIVDENQLTTSAENLVNAGFIELVEEVKDVNSENLIDAGKSINDIKVNDVKRVKSKK